MEKQGNSEITNFLLIAAGALAAVSCLFSLFSIISNLALLQRFGSGPIVENLLRSVPWILLWVALAVAGFIRWRPTLPIVALLSPMFLIFAVRPFFYRSVFHNRTLVITLLAGAVLKLALASVGIYGTFLWWKETRAKTEPGNPG
ncbi:MAG: hypothetical protein DIJKHBIC_02992 [Thermoanaerobaculia bacterium]|nr:hypothetical protein [Thermoanaerobaculia bacterium]